MKQHIVIGSLAVLLFGGIGYLLFSAQSVQQNDTDTSNVIDAPVYDDTPQDSDIACGAENCHGLKVECGPDVVEMCSMKYQIGDGCRKFVSCEVIDGSCSANETPAYFDCKACIDTCSEKHKDDPIGFSQCETDCAIQ